MNICKLCGAPAPEGKDLCWMCAHGGAMDRVKSINQPKPMTEEPVEECEMCKIPIKEEKGDTD